MSDDKRMGNRLAAVVAAFENLSASQKSLLIMADPELFFATAKLVRYWQFNARKATS